MDSKWRHGRNKKNSRQAEYGTETSWEYKKKKEGKDIKYDFIKNFLQLSASTTIIRDKLCYKKKIVFSPTKMPCNKSQV